MKVADYKNEILEAANSLDDALTEKVERGGHSTVYFGEKYVYKVTEKKVMEKSSQINSILSSTASKKLLDCISRTVLCKDLGDDSLVVENLKTGTHPEEISLELLTEIIELLQEVHRIEIEQVLTNFEGDSISTNKYWESQLEFAKQYAAKLKSSDTFSEEDAELIKLCLEVVKHISESAPAVPKLVLVYKDVHKHNTLVDEDGQLSGLIDWDAAMSGPVELEYVVLWARFKDLWPQIQKELGIKLNKDLFVASGIVQGLRFWKSFTKDSSYIDEQRNSLKRLLAINNSKLEDWESEL